MQFLDGYLQWLRLVFSTSAHIKSFSSLASSSTYRWPTLLLSAHSCFQSNTYQRYRLTAVPPFHWSHWYSFCAAPVSCFNCYIVNGFVPFSGKWSSIWQPFWNTVGLLTISFRYNCLAVGSVGWASLRSIWCYLLTALLFSDIYTLSLEWNFTYWASQASCP